MNESIKKVLLAALEVVSDRAGDVTTEDGDFATTEVGSMIELQTALAEAFNAVSDDVVYDEMAPIIESL